MKTIILVLTIALMSGCSSVADSFDKMTGAGQIEHSKNFEGFDGVTVTPTYLNNGGSVNNAVRLGAYYNDSSPDSIILSMEYTADVLYSKVSYTDITAISVRVDGEVTRFDTWNSSGLSSSEYNSVSHTIYTKSENSAIIPLSLFEKMLTAKSCKIRIHTSEGYEESNFALERSSAGQALAKLSFIKLYDEINNIKSKVKIK